MDPDSDPDPHLDPVIFVSDLLGVNNIFFSYYFFKDKSHKEVTKQLKSMFFLKFLLDDIRIRIRIHISD
jgi:hypothetical protein